VTSKRHSPLTIDAIYGFSELKSASAVSGGSRSTILCATGAEAVTAQHRPSRLWFERDAVRLAALIANNLELFALRSASLSRSAKVLAPRITAGFATLRMA